MHLKYHDYNLMSYSLNFKIDLFEHYNDRVWQFFLFFFFKSKPFKTWFK